MLRSLLKAPKQPFAARFFSLKPPTGAYESKIFTMLESRLNPTELLVEDISGGCGSMFAIKVVSPEFRGIPVIKQHRLVNEVLADEISKWHGLQLRTAAPKH